MCVYDEVTKVSEVPRPRVHDFLDCNITHVSSRAPLPHSLALIDVDRFNFVRVQLCQDRQRPARPLHLKRIRRVAGAPNPHCAPRGSALRSQASQASGFTPRNETSRSHFCPRSYGSSSSSWFATRMCYSHTAWLKSMAGRGCCCGGASGASSDSSAWSFTQANS